MKLLSNQFVFERNYFAIIRKEKFKRIGLLVFGIFVCQMVSAQENYSSGYIIKTSRDTLFGFVDYRNWDKNPDRISFKSSLENRAVSYEPTDILEFRVKNEIYVSAIVEVEVTQLQVNKLLVDPQFALDVDTTFLQTLIRGKKSLFYYKNAEARENFYIKQGANFELLKFKKYRTQREDGKPVIIENNRYKGQLILYLNDCESISSKLKNVSYARGSLIKFFQRYYDCSGSDIEFQQDREKMNLEVGVLAGTSITSLAFRSDEFENLVNAEYSTSVNSFAGLSFDLILPRTQNKWSFNNELVFSTYKVEGRYEELEPLYIKTFTEVGYSYLKLNSLARFKYPVGKIFVFINGGISNGIAISETNNQKKVIQLTESTIEGKVLPDTRKHEQGWLVGAGAKYNKISFEVRYEKGNGMSVLNTLLSTTTRLHFLLGYRF